MSRRSRPPRNRKSRTPEPSGRDVAVVIPPADSPGDTLAVADVRRAVAIPVTPPPDDELAEVDAGWD